MLSLQTPLIELHRHSLPRIGQATAQKLAVEIATISAKPNVREATLEDLLHYSNDTKSHGYKCSFQGITTGWADWYFKQLSGQWIDITGVPEGDYIVHVGINAAGTFDEGRDRYPDVIETVFHIPDPRKKVTVDNSPSLIDK